MSAILTYFDFMLQNRSCGRKDHTETALSNRGGGAGGR
jgi:hypothetical protein